MSSGKAAVVTAKIARNAARRLPETQTPVGASVTADLQEINRDAPKAVPLQQVHVPPLNNHDIRTSDVL